MMLNGENEFLRDRRAASHSLLLVLSRPFWLGSASVSFATELISNGQFLPFPRLIVTNNVF